MAKTVWLNGNIVTLNDQQPQAEAVVAENGKIIFVGSSLQARQYVEHDTTVIDLMGQMMLPGFYDAHSHFAQAAVLYSLTIDFSPKPFGEMENWQSCEKALEKAVAQRDNEKWIIARGFENALYPSENQAPDRHIIDQISKDVPIVIVHTSGHMSYLNSAALEAIGYQYDTPQPKGGIIHKDEETKMCTGILEGTANWPIQKLLASLTEDEQVEALHQMAKEYASKGVTTVNEGEGLAEWNYTIYLNAIKKNQFPLQAIMNPRFEKQELAKSFAEQASEQFQIKGLKMIIDGSIQNGSAYLSQPYYSDADHCGSLRFPETEINEMVMEAYKNKKQIYAHCNGDQAIEVYISAIEKAQECYPDVKIRPVVIHAQMMTENQLQRAKACGIIPSFFMAHVYYDGDQFCHSYIGPERGSAMNPAGWADQLNIPYTFHCDTPIIQQNPFVMIYAAVTRKCYNGEVIGADQKISRLHALKACTIWPAYQYFEEDKKGTIEVGKQADLIVVNKDLLHCDEEEILKTDVIETFVAGKSVYKHIGG